VRRRVIVEGMEGVLAMLSSGILRIINRIMDNRQVNYCVRIAQDQRTCID
jgi:hypothetical protein